MVKSIVKEIFIMLLLCVAIILVLGILFYDYIPANKVIPTKEAYTTSDEVKTEIEEEVTEMKKTEVSYEITDSNLNLYKQTSSYKPGKPDPFSLEETSSSGSGNNSNNNNKVDTNDDKKEDTSKNDQNNNTTSNTDKNSTGTFFDDKSIKW